MAVNNPSIYPEMTADPCATMVVNLYQHQMFKVLTTSSCLIGQWPYKSTTESFFMSVLAVSLFMTQFIPEVLAIIVHSDDSDLLLEAITPLFIDLVSASKFINFLFNRKMIKVLLERMKEDWKLIRKSEENILIEYTEFGRLLSIGYIGAMGATAVFFVIEPLLPQMIAYVVKSNATIPLRYPAPIYWVVLDMEKNYPLIWCISSFSIFVIAGIICAADTMLIHQLQHCCGLFEVVSYQIKHSPKTLSYQESPTDDIIDAQYQHFVMCIRNHKRAIEFAELLESTYTWLLGVASTLNAVLMSVTLVQIVIQGDSIEKQVKFTMYISAQLMHLFFECFLSQQLEDHSARVENSLQDTNWYDAPLKTQRLFVLMILRSQMPCHLTAGKLVVLSMMSFAMIVKTAGSFFTVFLSMQ